VRPRFLAAAVAGEDEPELLVDGGKLSVSGALLEVQPGSDFPPAPSLDGAATYQLGPSWLKDGQRVAVACAHEDTRPVLEGVLVDPKTGAMAAADGFRLRVFGSPDLDSVIVPHQVFAAAPIDVATLRLNPVNGQLVAPSATLTFMLIQGTFPKYAQLLPEHHDWTVVCSTAEFLLALAACRPIAAEGSGCVRLKGEGQGLSIRAVAEDVGAITRVIPAQVAGEFHIGFNMRYLEDALTSIGDTLHLSGTISSAPAMITDGEHLEVIMPMLVGAQP
jgi:DNA polymerase-3 subunit beta